MSENLLPCPFCGTTEGLYPAHHWPGSGKPYAIDCIGCGFDFVPREGTDVISHWNRRAPSPATNQMSEHPDDIAVDRFAAAMKAKLALKRDEGRGGWENKEECYAEFLSQLLREHVEKGDPIDVANFCMMLHQRGERILVSSQHQEHRNPNDA